MSTAGYADRSNATAARYCAKSALGTTSRTAVLKARRSMSACGQERQTTLSPTAWSSPIRNNSLRTSTLSAREGKQGDREKKTKGQNEAKVRHQGPRRTHLMNEPFVCDNWRLTIFSDPGEVEH
ncbi:hypothetical protein LZ32DRAFT_417452 [Colletotrichum eremochloae]|nr:hypothetical protein LZ32DRAFT_417452 [Colletotrichum eremochloae]